MDIQSLHQLIDEWAAKQSSATVSFSPPETAPEEPKKELPKDKRVIRTKSTGDNVYQVDEVSKVKQWVKNPEVLAALGWQMSDVQDLGDDALLGYRMGPSLYKADEA